MSKIFISYQTISHKEFIQDIKFYLEKYGFDTWTDISEIKHEPMRMSGLEISLAQGLLEADAILYLVPNQERNLTLYQKIREFFDWAIVIISYAAWAQGGKAMEIENPYFWTIIYKKYYKFAYNIDLTQRIGESWQNWEKRVSSEIGAKIISIYLCPDLTIEKNQKVIEESFILISENQLKEDVYSKLVPILKNVETRKPLELTEEAQALKDLFITISRIIIKNIPYILLCIIGLVIFIMGITAKLLFMSYECFFV
jgi:hypothetical protein